MNKNSNGYTIIYASILVVIVAFLLAAVSSALKSRQEDNVKLDTKKQILSSLGIKEGDVAENYNKYVKDYVINADGSISEYKGEFKSNYSDTTEIHVFECNIDGKTKYVFPLNGAGLWGPIWGYIALDDDKNTVYGTYFGHEGETPGLGADIATPDFQNRFVGKNVMDGDKVGLTVVKAGKAKEGDKFEVDGVTCSTFTSKGVDDMLKSCLSRFSKFLSAGKPCEAAASDSAACCKAKQPECCKAKSDCAANAAEGQGKAGYGDFSEVELRLEKVDSIKKEVKDDLKDRK